MRTRYFLHCSLMLLLISCNGSSGGGGKNDDTIAAEESALFSSLDEDDPLHVTALNYSEGSLSMSSPLNETSFFITFYNKSDETVSLNYDFEDGVSFDFAGEGFPGSYGTCDEDLDAHESCTLHLEFTADETGNYNDKLLITYSTESQPDETTVYIDLNGERTSLVPGLSVMKNIEKVINTEVGLGVETYLVIKNNGSEDALVSVQLVGSLIQLGSGTCSGQLASGEECFLKILSVEDLSVQLLNGLINLNVSADVGAQGN